MSSYKKDPNATLDYTVDWAPYLLPLLDTIVSVDWLPSAGLTVASSSFTATTATAFVSGGVLHAAETLTCRITTAAGRVDDRTLTLRIIDR